MEKVEAGSSSAGGGGARPGPSLWRVVAIKEVPVLSVFCSPAFTREGKVVWGTQSAEDFCTSPCLFVGLFLPSLVDA